MKKTVCTCDICNREMSDPKHMYHVKVRSNAFLNYVNQEEWYADRKKVDICKDCLAGFKEYMRQKIKYQI